MMFYISQLLLLGAILCLLLSHRLQRKLYQKACDREKEYKKLLDDALAANDQLRRAFDAMAAANAKNEQTLNLLLTAIKAAGQ